MENEKMLVEMGYAVRKRVTSREEFLRTMNYVIPWGEWIEYVRPFVPAENADDRQVVLLLRMYLLQEWFGLQDKQLEDTIYDSYAMWLFMGMNAFEEGLPSRATYVAFRSELKKSDVYVTLEGAIDFFLRRHGRKLVYGRMVEASIAEEMEEADVVMPPAQEDHPAQQRRHANITYTPPPKPEPSVRAEAANQAMEESEAVRRLEERLRKLEAKPTVAREEPKKADVDYEWRPGRGRFRRFLLTLIVLAIIAGAGVVVYDYLQTGTWFGWFAQTDDTAGEIEPSPTLESVFLQTVAPTAMPDATLAPTAESIPTQTMESLLQIFHTPAPQAIGAGTLGGVLFDADEEIQRNLSRLKAGEPSAAIVENEASPDKKISITIDGMYEGETMREILNLVKQHDIQVTFFLTGMQAAETPEIAQEIAEAGYPIGNYTLRGEAAMETQDARTLTENFTMTNKIIEVVTGSAPTRLKANATECTEDVLAAAGASGLSEVIQSTSYLTYHSFASYDEALSYINRLSYGSIVSVKLSGMLEPTEYQPLEIIETPAIDKEESVSSEESHVLDISEAERLLLVIQWLLEAVDNADFSPESIALREANGGALAETTQLLRTTQPAVAYTFYGDYGREEELRAIVSNLSDIGGTGTFFVSMDDTIQHPDSLRMLVDAGHTLGVYLSSASTHNYYSACFNLLRAREQLSSLFGCEARLVMQTGSNATDALREAVSSLDMLLVGADLTLTREETVGARTAQEMIDTVYGENKEGLQRGKILRFRLGYVERETLLGELILALEGVRNVYEVVNLYEMATNMAHVYTYPLPDEEILPEVLNRIYPGQLTATDSDFIDFAKQRYIGNPSISDEKRLPGFTRQEIYALYNNSKGRVSNVYDVAFLTFDDWGTDVGITKLLDVLRKHDAKATFFVRTEYVANNPNLLRAIAMEGHEIASHTHTHMPLANALPDTWIFEELTDEQTAALRTDIQASWDVLQHVVGDIRLENGQPALSTLFRSPTLAISRNGMETVFDMGMTYIVNGDYTSHDYEAESVDKLRRNLRMNIWNGTVAILHFSDSAIYTADAIDEYLTFNAAGENRRIYTYARLSDYLNAEESTLSIE